MLPLVTVDHSDEGETMDPNIYFHQLISLQHDHIKCGIPAQMHSRIEQLRRLEKLLVNEEQELCMAVYRDLKRTAQHTKILELNIALGEVRYCLNNLVQWMSPEPVERTVQTLLDTPFIVRDPLGCCLLIAPWNYPLLMVFLPLATMIAAGNTVVIKPSEMSPNVALALKKAFAKHFMPKNCGVVLADVNGTKELLRERFDLILYTGSTNVGREIMKAASQHLTPVVLELGGKCPTLVDRCADIPTTARRIAWGKFMNNGQTCVAPDFILVHRAVKKYLLDELRTCLFEFYEDAQKSEDYCRIINHRHFDRLNDLLNKTNGEVLIQNGKPDRDDLFFPPTVVDVERNDALMNDEIFGPILPLVTVNHLDEAVEFLKGREKPLALYVFSRDETLVHTVINLTRSGSVTVNDVVLQMGVDTLPFGGVGCSGFGHYRGKFGFDQFSHKKAILKRPFFGEQLTAARYPPLTEQKFNALRMLTHRIAAPRLLQRVWANWVLLVAAALLSFFFGLIYRQLGN